ncbi:hypothetical protein [Methanocella arvoryzae]|nr:hypothetical protein [Methanocella arvoryzae]
MAPSAQMASLKMPGMVPSLDKLTARINLMDRIGSEAMDEASVAASNAVKGKAAQMTYGIQKNIVQNMGKMSGAISLPGMSPVTGRLNDMRAIPAPGPMNMPDWTTPGIIFTL